MATTINAQQKKLFAEAMAEKLRDSSIKALVGGLKGLGDELYTACIPQSLEDAFSLFPKEVVHKSSEMLVDLSMHNYHFVDENMTKQDIKFVEVSLGVAGEVIQHSRIRLRLSQSRPISASVPGISSGGPGWHCGVDIFSLEKNPERSEFIVGNDDRLSRIGRVFEIATKLEAFKDSLKGAIIVSLAFRDDTIEFLKPIKTLDRLKEVWPEACEEFKSITGCDIGKSIMANGVNVNDLNEVLAQIKKAA